MAGIEDKIGVMQIIPGQGVSIEYSGTRPGTGRVKVHATGGGEFPVPEEECQVLFATTVEAFTPETPLVGPTGWLRNDDGCLLVVCRKGIHEHYYN